MNNALDLSEKLVIGGQTTALGLIVVFSCLVLIILMITLLSLVLKERRKHEEKKDPAEEKPFIEPLPPSPVIEVQDNELIAVLTAAVAAAMESEQNDSPFIIRSVKRTSGRRAWNDAGRDSRTMDW